MIWLSTVWDSHSTQLQGPTGRFDGQFIKLKICFEPDVWPNHKSIIHFVEDHKHHLLFFVTSTI